MVSNTKTINNSFKDSFPARAKKIPSIATAVQSLRAKIVIVGNSDSLRGRRKKGRGEGEGRSGKGKGAPALRAYVFA